MLRNLPPKLVVSQSINSPPLRNPEVQEGLKEKLRQQIFSWSQATHFRSESPIAEIWATEE
jgi:hypothetical protein